MERRQFGDHGRAVRRQEPLEHGEDALIAGNLDGQRALDLDAPVTQQERRHRVAADEREAAPPLAVLDGLEQEARAVADELGVGGDRRLEIGEQLGPHRHDGVVAGQRPELVAARADPHYSAPKRREKQEYSPV